MPWIQRTKAPAVTAEGKLRIGSYEHAVVYSLMTNPASLRAGPKGIRGSIEAEPEVAEAAFRAGDGFLVLVDGAEYRLKVLAHSPGDRKAYFEMWR